MDVDGAWLGCRQKERSLLQGGKQALSFALQELGSSAWACEVHVKEQGRHRGRNPDRLQQEPEAGSSRETGCSCSS